MNSNSYAIGDKVEYQSHNIRNGEVTELIDGWTHPVTGEKHLFSEVKYIVTFADGSTVTAFFRNLKPVTRSEEEVAEQRARNMEIIRQSEDVSREATKAAAKMQPTKTEKVMIFDTELGWVEEWVTVEEPTSNNETVSEQREALTQKLYSIQSQIAHLIQNAYDAYEDVDEVKLAQLREDERKADAQITAFEAS